jgi:pilus assembly protein Flp/PilA
VTESGNVPRREVIAAVLNYLTTRVVSYLPMKDEEGQGLAEYALILALIAIVAIVALIFLGNQISDKLSVVGHEL